MFGVFFPAATGDHVSVFHMNERKVDYFNTNLVTVYKTVYSYGKDVCKRVLVICVKSLSVGALIQISKFSSMGSHLVPL